MNKEIFLKKSQTQAKIRECFKIKKSKMNANITRFI